MAKIPVYVIGAKRQFQEWIETRGGVREWQNVNLSNPDAGNIYTPALDKDGKENLQKPHWAYIPAAVHKDIDDFQFVKEFKVVKTVKIALDRKIHGMTIRLTSASSDRVRKACAEAEEKYGVAPTYHFEDKEAIIRIPIMEDDEAQG